MQQRVLAERLLRPGRNPGPNPGMSFRGGGLPLQMHAFVPGGLHDHPPSTLLRMVVMQSLGVAEHQQGQPGALSSLFTGRGHRFSGDGEGIEAGLALSSAARTTAAGTMLELGGWPEQCNVVGAVVGVRQRRER